MHFIFAVGASCYPRTVSDDTRILSSLPDLTSVPLGDLGTEDAARVTERLLPRDNAVMVAAFNSSI